MTKSRNIKSRTVRERFDTMMRVTPGCWLWLRGKDKDGYGKFSARRAGVVLPGIDGRAHRAAYTIYVGPIPAGLHVLHKCDNPSCVNPDHLFVGTNSDNMKDRSAKGRLEQYRERNPSNKLSAQQAEQIRDMARRSTLSYKAIGEMYGVCATTVWKINKEMTWANK